MAQAFLDADQDAFADTHLRVQRAEGSKLQEQLPVRHPDQSDAVDESAAILIRLHIRHEVVNIEVAISQHLALPLKRRFLSLSRNRSGR